MRICAYCFNRTVMICIHTHTNIHMYEMPVLNTSTGVCVLCTEKTDTFYKSRLWKSGCPSDRSSGIPL